MNVIRFGVTGRLSEGVRINDRDFFLRQQLACHPGVAATGEYDVVIVGAGPIDCRLDLTHFIGVDHYRQVAAHIRQHRFPGRNSFRRRSAAVCRGVFGAGVGLCFFEEILCRPLSGAAFFGLLFNGLAFFFASRSLPGRGVEFDSRPKHMERDGLLDRPLLHRPALHRY